MEIEDTSAGAFFVEEVLPEDLPPVATAAFPENIVLDETATAAELIHEPRTPTSMEPTSADMPKTVLGSGQRSRRSCTSFRENLCL